MVSMLSRADVVFILNKCDLDSYHPGSFAELTAGGRRIRTSAKSGEGLEDLVEAILDIAHYDPARFESGLVVNVRQGDLLNLASASLARGIGVLEEGLGAEMAAVDLRECVKTLGILVGKDIGDAVLDHVFSSFCIGK